MKNPANKNMPGQVRPDILKKNQVPPEVKRFVINLSNYISKEEIHQSFIGPEIDWHYDEILELLSLQFSSWLYGEELATQIVSYPAGWWQAFKFRWFPGWLENIWPVEYEVVVIEASALYPKLRHKLSLPEEEHVLHIKREDE
jgi:hypothetical protein